MESCHLEDKNTYYEKIASPAASVVCIFLMYLPVFRTCLPPRNFQKFENLPLKITKLTQNTLNKPENVVKIGNSELFYP